ncbi:hypothetical protein DENSPDRAFT_333819 [Dentipellis sp. KUC8613]|nr:hypothetical protein DENSPDRAFT_333819 [Dentipellis sp. KUC8613]
MPTPCNLRPLGASNAFAPPRNRRAHLGNDAARAFHACAPPSRMLSPTPSLSCTAPALFCCASAPRAFMLPPCSPTALFRIPRRHLTP